MLTVGGSRSNIFALNRYRSGLRCGNGIGTFAATMAEGRYFDYNKRTPDIFFANGANLAT